MNANEALKSANRKVSEALKIRRDSPNIAFRMLIDAADSYEYLSLYNLSQNALEYALEVQCDFLEPDQSKFAELIREARIRNFARYINGGDA